MHEQRKYSIRNAEIYYESITLLEDFKRQVVEAGLVTDAYFNLTLQKEEDIDEPIKVAGNEHDWAFEYIIREGVQKLLLSKLVGKQPLTSEIIIPLDVMNWKLKPKINYMGDPTNDPIAIFHTRRLLQAFATDIKQP